MAEKENEKQEGGDEAAAAAAAKKAERAAKAKAKGGDKGEKGKAKAPAGPAKVYKREAPPRLKKFYEEEVRSKLTTEFSYTNPMQIPRIVKISINMGLGKATQNPKLMDSAVDEMRAISGRTPVVTLAKKDIATFKLRKGHKIGVMVTLRREAMWEFLDRFVNIALPRVRDFRGVSPRGFDGRGNFTMGVKEQIIFPEIEYDKIDSVKGMNISIVTTAETDAEGRALLQHLGMPFRQPTPTTVTPTTTDSGAAA
jgi:large subunit ribosomal protein L5